MSFFIQKNERKTGVMHVAALAKTMKNNPEKLEGG
ncbi:hypothetical protein AW02_009810 [Bacillus velezensis NJN-6]|uniref:Uncharacterized protein n=1 Tax=Bacillus velezensis TaxID=492670 RepID=A0A7W4LTU7_BACVE|nr:hypothetical protein U722_05020 [Bacillus amyloliquefaciens LFB112]AKD29133.1 hypothetical protein AW02_009810 [Bacillus velezensis NJN-6]ASB52343.1 hypothetical protein S100072_01006 [Bacillus velezensis]ERK82720.1 hypothetical protein N786_13945 [Bacillus amyloliquefaciens UASWS BA1]MCB5335961.1 hypothetical protein [Bacillus amyloliquefaciens]PWK04063.1 hypothetical protein C7819_101118 [Bacillus sp. VMFN-A1]COD14235.1 Uncharacterised protein [Streptococcus pneumoniae]